MQSVKRKWLMTLCDCNPNIFGQPNGKTPIDVRLLP